MVDTTNPQSQPHRKCQHPECSEKRVFKTDSAFRKHVDKHTRPYKCPIIGCKAKDFSNAGDLRRHHREVHTSPAFACPVVACKRHRKGFGRKDNLMQHLQRTHGEDVIGSSLASNSTTHGNSEDITSPNRESSMASESGNSAADDMETFTPDSSQKAFVIAKLQELEALKKEAIAKFDGDIAAFKKVLSYL
ncbi:hypothetical protein NA56DRAFT_653105 [Hyaloscypha hepaticicola]|uniref:C2H2-type domain-containing protein n=1 Tax=Hyaloscypha hepaticicola TaxID=2082293 RepID=A0A2J6QQ45_9HELO|nr:hypothetical protein NA56DRAFT_653105 [Hyaloscypha hepaticicola]